MSFFSRMRKIEILFWFFVVAFDTVGAADRHCKESCLFFNKTNPNVNLAYRWLSVIRLIEWSAFHENHSDAFCDAI